MINIIKGFIIGIGKIIPGVSGAVLAIILGVYDKSIEYINNFRKHKKESIKYLFPLGVGIIISILIFGKIIIIFLDKYYLSTMLLFIGLIIGGIPEIIIKVNNKNYIITIITFIVFFIISISNINNNYVLEGNYLDTIILFISGILEALGTIVPGISSTALLMIVGTYNLILSNLTNLNIIIPFIFGIVTGIILTIKLIGFLLRKYESKLYAFVLGMLLSSIVLLIIKAFDSSFNIIELIVGIILLIVGIFISSITIKK